MNGLLGTLLVGALLPYGIGAAAGKDMREPQEAHRARLSDRAQIEILMDAQRPAHASPAAPVDVVHLRGNEATVRTAEGGRLELRKRDGVWKIAGGSPPAATPTLPSPEPVAGTGMSAGRTFTSAPMSRELGVARLTRAVTQERLQRALFSTPEKTASFYTARYTSTAPFVSSTFVQFVTDPAWNRVVYGNLNHWIRTLDVAGPSAIAVDADGRVFIGESTQGSIAVYRLSGEGEAMHLEFVHRLDHVNATDIALDDRGTPLTTGDDLLYVADAVHHRVLCYPSGATGGAPTASWEGFESPSVVAVGKSNGASNGILYVVDRVGRRLRAFQTGDGTATVIGTYTAGYDSYLKSIKVDHFGSLYVVDNTRNTLLKLSPALEILDTAADIPFDGLAAVEIPFGRIEVEGEQPVWAGFDQAFAVERWSTGGGAARMMLGIRIKDVRFTTDSDRSRVVSDFTMTDAARVQVRILHDGQTVRTLAGSWMAAGAKSIAWDRRDDAGRYVAPGTYRVEIAAGSAYRDEQTVSASAITLPLYYREDCGSADAAEDAHLFRGHAVQWGSLPSESASQDRERVLYRFTGLRPDAAYRVSVELGAGDDVAREQVVTAGGTSLHDPVRTTTEPVRLDDVDIPAGCISNGEVVIGVERREGPDASVTQLWLKESGNGISVRPADVTLPGAYRLEQNYPNPFNPATTIRFALPEPAQVTLKVYTITGQEVATLVNDRREAGTYTVQFDAGKGLASGIYFYQIIAGEFRATRKLILLK
jgi:hypothetical protein